MIGRPFGPLIRSEMSVCSAGHICPCLRDKGKYVQSCTHSFLNLRLKFRFAILSPLSWAPWRPRQWRENETWGQLEKGTRLSGEWREPFKNIQLDAHQAEKKKTFQLTFKPFSFLLVFDLRKRESSTRASRALARILRVYGCQSTDLPNEFVKWHPHSLKLIKFSHKSVGAN